MQLKLSSDRAGLKTLVILQPDPEAYQQNVVNVINALKAVGISSISFGEG
jgi:biopolymer transport protein ExbD